MRKHKKQVEKLRVKILEAKRAGLTYEAIHTKTGASSRTIANLVKGKDITRFCTSCGETDVQKLHEHHPDKANRPNETVTLCANCHAAVTRVQQRERNKEKRIDKATPNSDPTVSVPTPPKTVNQTQVDRTQLNDLTPQQQRWIAKGICYGAAGIAISQGLSSEEMSGWDRLLMLAVGGILLYGGIKTE